MCFHVYSWFVNLQSRVGPVEWLKPYTDETIVELGKKGIRSLLAVPIRLVLLTFSGDALMSVIFFNGLQWPLTNPQ